jgi:predicted  nucleic acid-binding Zn-ribbon protein
VSTKEAKPDAPPKGVVAPSEPGGRSGFLSDVIVEMGFAERETVEKAVRAARSPGTTVSRVLVESDAVSEEQLAHATAERYGIAYVDLGVFAVDPGAANLIKASAARRYQALPIGFMGGGLLVAMADPADALAVNDIAVMTKMDVKPAVASQPALEALLESLPLNESSEPASAAPAAAGPEPEPEAEATASSAVFWQSSDEDQAGAREELPEGTEEVERLRERLTATAAELDQAQARARDAERAAENAGALQEELDTVKAELEGARADVEVRAEELDALRERLTAAEGDLVRVRAQIEELEDADRRAEQAREALAELREESECEREQLVLDQRDLQARLEESEARRSELEEAQQSMRDALRSLADPEA